MQFWCLLVIHFNLKFFVYRHHVPTKIARPECVDNRLAAASYGSTSSELGRSTVPTPGIQPAVHNALDVSARPPRVPPVQSEQTKAAVRLLWSHTTLL